MGFDAVESSTADEGRVARLLQQLKRRAFVHGMSSRLLDPQGFLFRRRRSGEDVDHTVSASRWPTRWHPDMRVNTGTWRTGKNFDELMKNRGNRPPHGASPTRTGSMWVIDG